jgi:hypothetical protein
VHSFQSKRNFVTVFCSHALGVTCNCPRPTLFGRCQFTVSPFKGVGLYRDGVCSQSLSPNISFLLCCTSSRRVDVSGIQKELYLGASSLLWKLEKYMWCFLLRWEQLERLQRWWDSVGRRFCLRALHRPYSGRTGTIFTAVLQYTTKAVYSHAHISTQLHLYFNIIFYTF